MSEVIAFTPDIFRKKYTRQQLNGLSDFSLLAEAEHACTLHGVCPQRLLQEITRRRDSAVASSREYAKRADGVRPAVILEQFLARTVRHPKRVRSIVEQCLQRAEALHIPSAEFWQPPTSEDIDTILLLTKNLLSAKHMARRAQTATQRAQRLQAALRSYAETTSASQPQASLPRRPSPSTRAWGRTQRRRHRTPGNR